MRVEKALEVYPLVRFLGEDENGVGIVSVSASPMQ